MLLGHAGHVAGRVQSGHGGFRAFVDAYARKTVSSAQIVFRGPQFDVLFAEVDVTTGKEAFIDWTFRGEQHMFNLADTFFGQMAELNVNGTAALGEGFVHHVGVRDFAFHQDVAFTVEHSASAGNADGQQRHVGVLDEHGALGVFHAGHSGTGAQRHDEAVAGVAGIVVHSVEIFGIGQGKAAHAAGSHQHGLGLTYDHLACADVHAHGSGHAAVVHE